MKRVVVTGSSGFIGRAAVAALLGYGFEVHGISRCVSEKARGFVGYVGDVLDADVVSRIIGEVRATHLLHLAWYTEHGAYWSSPLNEQWVKASEHLFRAFIEAGGSRIVGAGTCAEYDWSSGICVEDSTPLTPATAYGAAKAELCRRLKMMPVAHVWARLFFTFGPHEPVQKFIPSTIRNLLRGVDVTCRSPDVRRDFIHVDDVGEALASFVDGDATGSVNVGSGVATELSTIATMIAVALHAPQHLHFERGLTSEAPLVVADPTRLSRLFGFRPKIDLAEGLRRTISWWKTVR
jgi:nucleoside-diphosphate-sugar epimerase